MGKNCTASVTDCPGNSLAGNVPPANEKPVPATETLYKSSGQVPTDLIVTNCFVAVFNVVLPNARLDVLTLIVETTAPRLRLNAADAPAEEAVNVTFCAVPTAETRAVNAALVDPAASVTVAGATTVVLLLDRLIIDPPVGAAELRATLQVSFTIPLTDALVQESDATLGAVCAPEAGAPNRASAQEPPTKSVRKVIEDMRIFPRCSALELTLLVE